MSCLFIYCLISLSLFNFLKIRMCFSFYINWKYRLPANMLMTASLQEYESASFRLLLSKAQGSVPMSSSWIWTEMRFRHRAWLGVGGSPSAVIFRVLGNCVLKHSFLLKHFIILRNRGIPALCLLSCLPFFPTWEATPTCDVLRGFWTYRPFPLHTSVQSWEPFLKVRSWSRCFLCRWVHFFLQ